MSDNLNLYEKFRSVPDNAQREIKGGRLNGKTDINPMWRIKTLTEQFGPCGTGWWYEITDKHLERTELGEVAAFVDIALYYVVDGQTSKPVYGTGGSSFIAKEKSGLYVSDECYKMALTDAISVACKALGVGADIYWEKDATKYTGSKKDSAENEPKKDGPEQPSEYVDAEAAKLRKLIIDLGKNAGRDESKVRMFAEELVERATKKFVKFDDMDVGILTKVKIELANKIAGK